ncbi:hypothetical protein [Bacillus massiliigorillae]|uniref:hypothetical protein n=1 Tax=Bacillus massiliigorillae TaxID=1243664 RepID=UPI0003A49A39|nr:hypothetical protein [Bacillus massiliigorillae]
MRSAINATQVQIKFNQAVKTSTVISNTTTGALNGTNIAFTSLDGKEITESNATAKLSDDGKTLVVTAGLDSSSIQELFAGRYQVVIKNVQNTESKKIADYDEVVNLGKDTTAPTVASVEKQTSKVNKVTFSEPIGTLGNFTFKLANGTVVPSSDVTVSALSTDKKSVTLTVSATKYAGKTITATLLGTKDFAGNLLNPNPTTFNFQVGDKDGVAPTVTSLKAISDSVLEVEFSEEVQNFETSVSADADNRFKVTGGAPVTATKIEQNSNDKKKYTVTLSGSAISSGNSVLADVKINKTITLASTGTSTVTDLSGEDMEADYTQILSIKKDVTAPTLESSQVVEVAGVKYLELKFNEKLSTTTSGTPALPTAVASSASAYKDYVTVSDKNFAFGTAAGDVALTTDGKGVQIKLANAKFDSSALIEGTKYKFKVNATDVASNTTTEPIEVVFTYQADVSADEPKLTNSGGIVANDNNTVTLKFDRELDGASATNVANYSIAGVEVKSATLKPVSSGTQEVVLKLGENTLTGERAISISGVKSKAGIEMKAYNDSVNLTENVKPYVVSAKVTGTKTIEVTFSEEITAAGIADKDDFVIKIGNATTGVAYGTTANALSADNKVVTITLDSALTEAQIAETLTLEAKVGATSAIEDNATNIVKVGSVTIAK